MTQQAVRKPDIEPDIKPDIYPRTCPPGQTHEPDIPGPPLRGPGMSGEWPMSGPDVRLRPGEQSAIPDRLAALRDKIAALEAEERTLRDILVADPSARLGGDYVATVAARIVRRVRLKDLAKVDPKLAEKLTRKTIVHHVWLTKRVSE